MEFGLAIAVILAVAVAFLYVKFANFKSKLMNELGRRGLTFDQADVLYTIHINKVHEMQNNGSSIDAIANMIISNTNSVEESASKKLVVPEPSRNQDSHEKEKNVIVMVTETIAMQLMLSPKQSIDADDDFAVGYLIGYADAAMQKTGIDNNSAGGMFVLVGVCSHFLGSDLGSATVGKFINNQMSLPKSFRDGLLAGGQDIFNWLGGDRKIIPSSLSKYNFENYG